MNNLENEVREHSQEVHTTEMKMSIGEIINLYRDKELIIRPEFQRLFRWEVEQKSRLIESILIGIPIPPIFVQQRKDGVWEIIDGLQRVSTILEFVGVLKDKKPQPLEETNFTIIKKYHILKTIWKTIQDSKLKFISQKRYS